MANQLTVKLETVTPLFLGGSEPRGAPELREASVRGALRYWLRAALGSVQGGDVAAVREAESRVFGSTSRASDVIVRLAHPAFQAMSFEKAPPVRVARARRPKPTGRDYLFWSMAQTGSEEKGNFQPAKQAIPEKTSFTLTLAARIGAANADDALYQAAAALWLLIHLGGLGSRSRRTAGSLRVAEPVTFEGLPSFVTAETAKDLCDVLGRGVTAIRQRLDEITHAPPSVAPPRRFDALHPATCRIWVLSGSTPWGTSQQAVEEIGAHMRDFRSYRPPDHDTIREWLDGGKRPPTVARAVFGLPLPFRYSDGGPADVLQGRDHDRRASPLHLRVSRLASGEYVGVAVLFESEFFPEREALRFQRSKQETAVPPDYRLIHEFVGGFKALEVNFQ